MRKITFFVCAAIIFLFALPLGGEAAYHFGDFEARPPIHIFRAKQAAPTGITPDEIKATYKLPKDGGKGTIALIGAYDDPTIEADLNTFSAQFGLPKCTSANGCFKKYKISTDTKADSGWSLETSLDVEWAHAIAPRAKILLVEAKTPSGKNLLAAVDYARKRADVIAISMSWGGAEFPEETTLDNHFTSDHSIAFFASSGDNGWGASWPAVSQNVVAVGGTTLNISKAGTLKEETAWSGSGGGVSAYEAEPAYQTSYKIPRANGKRAIPDVSYNADPASGFPVYKSSGSRNSWYTLGGTSAGAPQWAAIHALKTSVSHKKLYDDKASENYATFFRDIVSGANGSCAYYCEARKRYDYVTGLGSPQTAEF